MKKICCYILLIQLLTNCTVNRFLLNDTLKKDKYFLKSYIKSQIEEGEIDTKPLIVIDGKPYRYNVELKRSLNINRSNILDLNIINKKSNAGTLVWQNHAKDGVVLVNTNLVTKKESNDIHRSNVVYFVDGIKVSKNEVKNINPKNVESLQVINPKDKIYLFNGKKLDGVVFIFMKKEH